MKLKTITWTALMELYGTGCVNDNDEVNIGLVEGAGYEDGEKLGMQICQKTPCNISRALFTFERDLKESYQSVGNEAMAELLEFVFETWEFEPWKAVEVMVQHDKLFDTYLHHFILGLSDSFMERAANCRNCAAQ